MASRCGLLNKQPHARCSLANKLLAKLCSSLTRGLANKQPHARCGLTKKLPPMLSWLRKADAALHDAPTRWAIDDTAVSARAACAPWT